MKNIYSVISSLVTAILIYVAVVLDMKVKAYVMESFNGIVRIRYVAIALILIGFCVAWNLRMLQKSNIVAVVISIAIAIVLIAIIRYWPIDGFLYPMALIGAYGFMLVSKLLRKKNKEEV